MKIHIVDSGKVWEEAEKYLLHTLDDSIEKEKTLVLLSGGSVARMYGGIARWIRRLSVVSDPPSLKLRRVNRLSVSKKIAFAQVDERFQPNQLSVKNEINAYQIEQTGLWKACDELGIPYYLISQKGSLNSATDSYSKEISRLWERDEKKIGILGIGEDGHIAGLLPGYRDLWDTERRKNKGNTGDKRNKGDSGGLVVGYRNEGTFPQRISLTLATIRMLDAAVVVATGEKKKKAIREVFDPKNKHDLNQYPGAILQAIAHVHVFTDRKSS